MKTSAGIILFRSKPDLQILLAHPGGPLWTNKDQGWWGIPKGEYTTEDPEIAARREFEEETRIALTGSLIPLGTITQSSAKKVMAWASEGDCDPSQIVSNTFSMEWPRGSGKLQTFPEVDRVQWFPVSLAINYILKGQAPFIFRLTDALGGTWPWGTR